MSAPADGQSDKQHSVARSVVLHLLPGALITVFYVLLAPVARSLGFPSLMATFLAILFVLVPFELGYLLYRSRIENGDLSLRNMVLYRNTPRGRNSSGSSRRCSFGPAYSL